MLRSDRNRKTRRYRPRLEVLCDRTLMATGVTAKLAAGVLEIRGTAKADTIKVHSSAGQVSIEGVKIQVGRSLRASIPARSISLVKAWGSGGNDRIDLNVTQDPRMTLRSIVDAGAGNDLVLGGEGADVLSGGPGNDQIRGRGGPDRIDGGAGQDIVMGDGGDDQVNGGAGDDQVNGNLGADSLRGGAGKDRLSGQEGNDVLDGDEGDDVLLGGTGDDTYSFRTAAAAQADAVTELPGQGSDTLSFATLAADDPVSVNLSSDAGLAGHRNRKVRAGGAGQAANLEVVLGGAGDDQVLGNNADNVILGGGGSDALAGGPGNDTYAFGPAGAAETDTLTELAGGGRDRLDFSGVAADASQFWTVQAVLSGEFFGDPAIIALQGNRTLRSGADLGANFEDVSGSAGNDFLWGNSSDNRLTGGGGNDDLRGGDGDDTLDGGNGDDFLAGEADPGQGGTGQDILRGGDGNDTLDGGPGNDRLDGGNGDDEYRFDPAEVAESDTVVEAAGAGTDRLDFSSLPEDPVQATTLTAALAGGYFDDPGLMASMTNRTLATTPGGAANFEDILGTAGSDLLMGNSSANRLIGGPGGDTIHGEDGDDLLDGGRGFDVLFDGEGSDQLIGGEDNDVYFFSDASAPQTDTLTELAGGGSDVLEFSQVRADLTRAWTVQAVLSGEFFDDPAIIAQQANRTLVSGADQGANIEDIFGSAGNDFLWGNSSANRLNGGPGDDDLRGGDGDDLLTGGAGDDFLAGAGEPSRGGTGHDTLRGDDGNDTLEGGPAASTLDGGAGDDTIDGGASGDQLLGNDGNDTLTAAAGAGAGACTLDGGYGDDVLNGGPGDDVLLGGDGDDRLYGGAGLDALDCGAGNDAADGGAGADRIDGALGDDTLWGGDGRDLITGGDGDDSLHGGEGSDSLYGLGGRDFLAGDSGDDRLDDMDGDDDLAGGPGYDLIARRYDLKPDGSLFRFDAGAWSLVDTNVRTFVLGDDDSVYVLDRNNTLYRDFPGTQPSRRDQIDVTVRSFAPIGDGSLYVLGADSNLWHETPGLTSTLVEQGVSDVSLGGDLSRGGNGILRVSTLQGEVQETLLGGDPAAFMEQARQQEAAQGQDPGMGNGRGIVGAIKSPGYLANMLGADAPKALLGSIGKVQLRDGSFGSGTLLDRGGNRFVLTAAHVVEDDNGNQLPASTFTFRYSSDGGLSFAAGAKVAEVIGRSNFGGRDLALLRLEAPLPGIQGALLPGETDVLGPSNLPVVVAGYGDTDAEHGGTTGDLHFGFAEIDELNVFQSGAADGQIHPAIGYYLVNRYNAGTGEVAIDHGDSGGPDFLMRKVGYRDGSLIRYYWFPEIIGVHSFGEDANGDHRTSDGELSWSAKITADVVTTVENLIQARTTGGLYARFQILIINDGDTFPGPAGEWNATLTVNGTNIPFVQNVNDGDLVAIPPDLNVDLPDSLVISFSGIETDGFPDSDDQIPLLSTRIRVPRRYMIGQPVYYTLGERSSDTSYRLYVTYLEKWVVKS